MRAAELDRLWEEFHHAVNMTSRELSAWLRTQAASETADAVPGQGAPATGQQVARILGKRRTDLTDADFAVMRQVVDTVRFRCGSGFETTAGQPGWRDKLMNLGHDPLKPA